MADTTGERGLTADDGALDAGAVDGGAVERPPLLGRPGGVHRAETADDEGVDGGPNPIATALLGGVPDLTADDISAAAQVSVTDARRLWRALGFPAFGDDSPAYTPADLEALLIVRDAIIGQGIPEDVVLRLTRALGSTMSRLADWQVSTLTEQVAMSEAGLPLVDPAAAVELADTLRPAFEQLLVYAWRRHTAAAVVRAETGAAEPGVEGPAATVGFADLVSFTALSNGLDDHELAALVEGFESRCTDLVTAGGGRAIKSLGDSVLYVTDSASAGVDIAFAIVDEIGRDKLMPDVRVGLASGPLLTRLGDVYGPPVNMAARLTSVARRNRVIIDVTTADELGDDYETRALPPRPLHGFGTVEPLTVRRRWSYVGADPQGRADLAGPR